MYRVKYDAGERNQDLCIIKDTTMAYQEEWDYVRGRITELRKARGLSIQALADIADIERPNLSRLESGRSSSIHFTTLCKLADALGVPPGDLVRR
jgi:DNA-binding Xre family transcriptional regulator